MNRSQIYIQLLLLYYPQIYIYIYTHTHKHKHSSFTIISLYIHQAISCKFPKSPLPPPSVSLSAIQMLCSASLMAVLALGEFNSIAKRRLYAQNK